MKKETIKIDKNIEIPKPPPNKYPFGEMKKGDSFLIQGKNDYSGLIHNAIRRYKIKHPNHQGKYLVRKVEGGYRCWLID